VQACVRTCNVYNTVYAARTLNDIWITDLILFAAIRAQGHTEASTAHTAFCAFFFPFRAVCASLFPCGSPPAILGYASFWLCFHWRVCLVNMLVSFQSPISYAYLISLDMHSCIATFHTSPGLTMSMVAHVVSYIVSRLNVI